MKFSIITVFPEMIRESLKYGVLERALSKKVFSVEMVNPRAFTQDVHKTVDDRPFGGGDGMIMLAETLKKSVESVSSKPSDLTEIDVKPYVVYLSPQGTLLNESQVLALSQKKHLVLVCGRYGGVDQRFINESVDQEISIGDYVLSGGELAACVVIDAVARKISGVLGHASSSEMDSLSLDLNGWLEGPSFTRPPEFENQKVPDILLSGHHQKIADWRKLVSFLITLTRRPDLIQKNPPSVKYLKEIRKALDSDIDFKILGLTADDISAARDWVEGLN